MMPSMTWIIGVGVGVGVGVLLTVAVIAIIRLLDRVTEAGGAADGDASVMAGQVIAQLEAARFESTEGRIPWDGKNRLRDLDDSGVGPLAG
jgi:precorrin-2 methylase